jgi:rRNA pseudouridine-1189 N-methylase Emg1 (Nep1/Mra1 family)
MAFQLLVEKVIGTTKTKKLRNQNPPKMVLKQSRKIKRIEKLSLKNDSKDLDTVEIIMALFLDEVIMILR